MWFEGQVGDLLKRRAVGSLILDGVKNGRCNPLIHSCRFFFVALVVARESRGEMDLLRNFQGFFPSSKQSSPRVVK